MQRPLTAQSAHGAVLTIHNEKVEETPPKGETRAPGNGLVIASGPNPDNEIYTLTIQPGAGTWKQLGLEIVPDESLPGLGVARGADRMVISELEVAIGGRNAGLPDRHVEPEQSGGRVSAGRGDRSAT